MESLKEREKGPEYSQYRVKLIRQGLIHKIGINNSNTAIPIP